MAPEKVVEVRTQHIKKISLNLFIFLLFSVFSLLL